LLCGFSKQFPYTCNWSYSHALEVAFSHWASAQQGYLMVITLRHADEVIPVSQLDPPRGRALEPKERDLAGKLIEALFGEFDAEARLEPLHEIVERDRIRLRPHGTTGKSRSMPKVEEIQTPR